MKYFLAYLAVGALLVAQARIRGWKYSRIRNVEDVLVAVGLVVCWFPFIFYELVVYIRDRRYRK